MWDYLAVDEEGKGRYGSRNEDNQAYRGLAERCSKYYALQAALYAYLLGVDNVVMVASFLEEKDYNDPAKFVPNIKEHHYG